MSEPTDEVSWTALAAMLAAMPAAYRRLLVEHTDAGCGRCRACTVPGTGSPGAPWPCSIHKLATLAQNIDRRRLR